MTDLSVIHNLTMSSREIAELTGKQHSNVMRDIRVMAEELMNSNLNPCVKSTTYVGKDGRTYDQYEIDKETTLCLISGYDATLRMRIIKRWAELEAANMRPLTTMEMVAQMALKAVEQERIAAEHEAKLIQHEARLEKTEAQIKDIVDTEQWFTARAAGILYNYRHLSSSNVQKLGKALANKSREMALKLSNARIRIMVKLELITLMLFVQSLMRITFNFLEKKAIFNRVAFLIYQKQHLVHIQESLRSQDG